jgi:tetratricopeptide (TPR) repeat protein
MQTHRLLLRPFLPLTLFAALVGAAVAPSAHADSAPMRPSGLFGDFLAGHFAEQQGDTGYAALELLEANRDDPNNAELRQQAFVACVLDQRPEALALAQQLPDDPGAELFLADQEAAAGNWDRAEQRFRNLPHDAPTQLVQPLLIAWAQAGAGKTDAALATLQPLMQTDRLRGVYALHAALIADLAGRDADRLYHSAQQAYNGVNIRLAQILASWQARQGDSAAATATLDALPRVDASLGLILPQLREQMAVRPVMSATDGIAEAYLALGGSLRQDDSPEFTLFLLRLALDVRPSLTAARLVMADTLEASGHSGKALAVLEAVGPNDPLTALVELRRVGLEVQLGRKEDAMQRLERLASAHPASPEPLMRLGDILRGENRFTEAVDAYSRAIQRIGEPTRADWSLFYARGIAYDRAGEWDKAEADLQHALQLSPDQPYVLNYLGYSLTEQNRDLDRARQMIEKAAELRPNDGAILDSMGWVLVRQGNPAEAIRWLERAVESESEDATINGHLGDAYWAVGRKLQAEFQWRRALNLNPEPADAAKLQAKLRDAGVPAVATTPAAATATRLP